MWDGRLRSNFRGVAPQFGDGPQGLYAMLQRSSYETVLATSLKAAWRLEDVFPLGQELDFSRNFLPESLVRTAELVSLTRDEQRALNQINAHEYLRLFVLAEEFIIPALLDHSRSIVHGNPARLRAILNFAGEEAKHIHLFERFEQAFVRQFPVLVRKPA